MLKSSATRHVAPLPRYKTLGYICYVLTTVVVMMMINKNGKRQEDRKEKEVQRVNARRHQCRSRRKRTCGPAAVRKDEHLTIPSQNFSFHCHCQLANEFPICSSDLPPAGMEV